MTKQEYIEDHTKYWIEVGITDGVKITKRLAKDCAERDYLMYIEKLG